MLQGAKNLRAGAMTAAMAFASLSPIWAANGTWQGPTGDSSWDTDGNWVGGIKADGANFTANFTGPDLTAGGNLVTMDIAPHTIGNIVFSDSIPGTGTAADVWNVQGIQILTLSNTTQPTITVNALPTGSHAVLNVPVAGTQGFTKAGVGELRLGTLGGAHTFIGGINVNGGTLYYETGVTVPVQDIVLRNGATLNIPAGLNTNAAGSLNVAAGTTGNLVYRGAGQIFRGGGGANSVLNITAAADGVGTPQLSGNWATGGRLSGLNLQGVAGGAAELIEIEAQNTGSTGATYAHFQDAAVNLNDIVLFTRTRSGGETVAMGSLSGTTSAVLSGGGGSAGSFVTYSVGSLNTNTTFAGTIDTTSAPPNGVNNGGLNLNKVGTGTLTLSGTLTYAPTLNGTIARRGGITTVSAGTLKLTNNAAIPGGTTDGVTTAPSTIRLLLSTSTLDVSGVATPYSTAARQQVIGIGNILGNYIHDAGVLAPGDTISGTTSTLVGAAGTLTFANNLAFTGAEGSGAINFNISPSLTSGNDKILVNGATTLTGTSTVTVNALGGVTNGLYTLIESTGGFVGNASGWTVNLGGRGGVTPLVVNGNLLQMNVSTSSFGNVFWTGNADTTTWVAGVAGPLNWRNTATNVADRFFDFDTVTFADTDGVGNAPLGTAITLNTTVSPLVVNVTSSTLPYTFSGTGKISGGASLIKSGSSTLTLSTANDFTGTATINGGTVDIQDFKGALGTGPLTLGGGSLIASGASAGSLTNATLTVSGTNTIQINGPSGSAFVLPAWSGAGSTTISSTTATKTVDIGNNNGFTGTLTVETATIRFNGSSTSLAGAAVVLTNGGELRDRVQGGGAVITLGSIASTDLTSTVGGYDGGGTIGGKTWRIGALNTSTTFAGRIVDRDPAIGTDPLPLTPTTPTNLAKIGTGTLTLAGVNGYSGYTAVEGGTLSLSPAITGSSNYLADAADVLLFTGGILQLNTAGETDTIDQLFVNGINVAPGVYGGIGSAAAPGFQLTQITGTGLLNVVGFRIPGDFNGIDGVNAADLDVWKAARVANNATGDTDGDGDSDGNDFLIWQRYLGTPASTVATAAVPEPASALLAAGAMLGLVGAARRRK